MQLFSKKEIIMLWAPLFLVVVVFILKGFIKFKPSTNPIENELINIEFDIADIKQKHIKEVTNTSMPFYIKKEQLAYPSTPLSEVAPSEVTKKDGRPLDLTISTVVIHNTRRFAVINNNIVKEGQKLSDTVVVEKISAEGVVFNIKGEKKKVSVN